MDLNRAIVLNKKYSAPRKPSKSALSIHYTSWASEPQGGVSCKANLFLAAYLIVAGGWARLFFSWAPPQGSSKGGAKHH